MRNSLENITGTPEEKVKKLTTIISRMSRRLHKTSVGIIPAIPLSACVTGEDISGEILRSMLFKGNIGKGMIVFNEKPKTEIEVMIKIINGDEGITKSFYVNTKTSSVNLNIDTIDGTRVIVSINSKDDKYKVTEIWLSVLWTPHTSSATVKQHLIDALDKVSETNVSEE